LIKGLADQSLNGALAKRLGLPRLVLQRWFVPVVDLPDRIDATPAIASGDLLRGDRRYPWAHLKIGQRADLRQAYATLLRERVARNAPAVPIPPPRVTDDRVGASLVIPIEGGCLFCGVSNQLVPAVTVAREGPLSVARDLWTPKRTGTQQLGGQPSPQQLSGHLCRSCSEAVDHVGAVGPTALERALVSALMPEGVGKLAHGNLTVDGLVGWGALVARAQQGSPPGQPAPRPNTRPWEHLGDLGQISTQLARRLGVSA
jgi:hypothetical protein